MNRQQRRAAQRQSGGGPRPPGLDAQTAFVSALQLQQAGRLGESDAMFRQVLALDPSHADSLHLMGLNAMNQGRVQAAADLIRKAVAADGANAAFHNNLGSVYRELGLIAQAQDCWRRALSLRPDYPRALTNLGMALSAQGQTAEAIACLSKAVALKADDIEACWTLALLHHQSGALNEAEALYGRLLRLSPSTVEVHDNLAQLLLQQGRNSEAIERMRAAIRVEPAGVERRLALAAALHSQARLSEAVETYEAALRLQSDHGAAWNGLGNSLAALGRLEESVTAYRRAIAIAPDHLDARSNLLMTLHSQAEVSAADILAEARAFAARFPPVPPAALSNSPAGNRPLRIGYVSADFRIHPVGFFLERVLPAHDPSQVEIVLYSAMNYADALTDRLRAAAAGWRTIAGLDDARVRQIIADDKIDILVDLAGHTGANRLPLFACRAAPVQAEWLGYFGTTGLDAIDYVIADEVVLPPGDEAFFTETPVRVGAPYLCWSPPDGEVPTAPFPAQTNGFVTFGCFNNRAKINPQTIAAWAQILSRVAGSRLFIKSWSMADQGCREALLAAFAAHGIEGHRLMFEGLTPRLEGLAAYNRVDIALDPFPFGGCTSTADTLWMGVPLVTQAGARWSGRMSQTILSCLGLEEWVAADTDDYVETAVTLAGRLDALAPLRAGLRERIEASAFCDGQGFARRLEAAYRRMWRDRCAAEA